MDIWFIDNRISFHPSLSYKPCISRYNKQQFYRIKQYFGKIQIYRS